MALKCFDDPQWFSLRRNGDAVPSTDQAAWEISRALDGRQSRAAINCRVCRVHGPSRSTLSRYLFDSKYLLFPTSLARPGKKLPPAITCDHLPRLARCTAKPRRASMRKKSYDEFAFSCISVVRGVFCGPAVYPQSGPLPVTAPGPQYALSRRGVTHGLLRQRRALGRG